jgi:hypothetical protein|tara:strand:- start:1042 stop:1248 length:207 start_codon:yes stop_codon:yes gene_type:complete
MMDKRLENVINIIRSLNESMGVAAMGGPTNNVGDGKIAGAVPGEDPPVRRKKKRYIYGGTGSRKFWLK